MLDPSGAAITGASVEIENPVSHYTQATKTDSQGNFALNNVPFNNYHVSANASGFQRGTAGCGCALAPIPFDVKITLKIGTESSSVTVVEAGDLIETNPVTHTDIDRGLFDKMPLESQSSSLSSLVTLASPGISADSNGLFHGLGDHASNSFSLDGQPITDQQSKVFSNQIPLDAVQSMEVIEGAPPAEYGDKTSVVINVTTRSGLGATDPHGDITASYGTFGTANVGFNLSYGQREMGQLHFRQRAEHRQIPRRARKFQVYHDHGNEENFFDQLQTSKPSASNDTINLNIGFTRSWFQTPNSFDGQTADAWSGLVVNNGGLGPNGLPVGSQDQRSKIRTYNIAPTWTHLLNPEHGLHVGRLCAAGSVQLFTTPAAIAFAGSPTPDLQSETIGQSRTLTNLGARANVSYVKGIHNIKVGINYEDTILTEKDSFGIVDPTFNPVCLNADGSPNTDPSLTNPNNCTGTLQPNPGL